MKQIEEDFHATRKIARSDLETTNQLLSALYPFIPIQHLIPFEAENPRQRVRERLTELPKVAVEALFDESEDPQETWNRFVDSYEASGN